MTITHYSLLNMVGVLTKRFEKENGEIDSDKRYGFVIEETGTPYRLKVTFGWIVKNKPVPPMVDPATFDGVEEVHDDFIYTPEMSDEDLVKNVFGIMETIAESKVEY